jgi:hypothetical protein
MALRENIGGYQISPKYSLIRDGLVDTKYPHPLIGMLLFLTDTI